MSGARQRLDLAGDALPPVYEEADLGWGEEFESRAQGKLVVSPAGSRRSSRVSQSLK